MQTLLQSFVVILLIMGAVIHAADRPNVLWFVVDDMSANFSCYGEKTIRTPAVDQLAEDGLLFTRAYATSPVCSTFRSAMITGMYQNSIGSHHHRSGRGEAPHPVARWSSSHPRTLSNCRLFHLHGQRPAYT